MAFRSSCATIVVDELHDEKTTTGPNGILTALLSYTEHNRVRSTGVLLLYCCINGQCITYLRSYVPPLARSSHTGSCEQMTKWLSTRTAQRPKKWNRYYFVGMYTCSLASRSYSSTTACTPFIHLCSVSYENRVRIYRHQNTGSPLPQRAIPLQQRRYKYQDKYHHTYNITCCMYCRGGIASTRQIERLPRSNTHHHHRANQQKKQQSMIHTFDYYTPPTHYRHA